METMSHPSIANDKNQDVDGQKTYHSRAFEGRKVITKSIPWSLLQASNGKNEKVITGKERHQRKMMFEEQKSNFPQCQHMQPEFHERIISSFTQKCMRFSNFHVLNASELN